MAYLIHLLRRKQLLNIIPLFASIITVFLVYRLLGVASSTNYYNLLALDICIAIIASILAIFYVSKPHIFVALVILLIAGFMIYATNYSDAAFAGMFAIGTTYGLLYREFALSPPKKTEMIKKNKNREIARDLIQIVLGIVLLAVAYVFPYLQAIFVIFGLIMIGYTTNNLMANFKSGYRKIADLERRDVSYGLGASYLAGSTALVIGFVHSASILYFSIIVLFFADSLATIVGISIRNAMSLPYNKYKTVIGTLVFFIIAASAGYFVMGLNGILSGFILAFIESINLSLDDNVRSGIVLVILNSVFGH
jgi:dolichol kinase